MSVKYLNFYFILVLAMVTLKCNSRKKVIVTMKFRLYRRNADLGLTKELHRILTSVTMIFMSTVTLCYCYVNGLK